jgi:hypothetical protein
MIMEPSIFFGFLDLRSLGRKFLLPPQIHQLVFQFEQPAQCFIAQAEDIRRSKLQQRTLHVDQVIVLWTVPRARFAPIVAAVEERVQLIVFAIGNRIVLVIVTAGASDRHPEEHSAGGVDTIDHGLHSVLLTIGTGFDLYRRIAMETCGDELIVSWIG